jgi:hypothetical protein
MPDELDVDDDEVDDDGWLLEQSVEGGHAHLIREVV